MDTVNTAETSDDLRPKPELRQAMILLLTQLRETLPFDAPEAHLCQKVCVGCPKKLMAFIEGEVEGWEQALNDGVIPSFGDIAKLAKLGKKVHAGLVKNGIALM